MNKVDERACKRCECLGAGWCERHRRYVTQKMFENCDNDPKYRAYWDIRTHGNVIREINKVILIYKDNFKNAALQVKLIRKFLNCDIVILQWPKELYVCEEHTDKNGVTLINFSDEYTEAEAVRIQNGADLILNSNEFIISLDLDLKVGDPSPELYKLANLSTNADWTKQDSAASAEVKKAGILQMGKNFINARQKWIEAGRPFRPLKERRRIFNQICKTCEHFTGKRCEVCGCFIDETRDNINKLAWATEECPVGKWGKYVPKENEVLEKEKGPEKSRPVKKGCGCK